MKKYIKSICLTAAAAIVLTACGGSSGSTSSTKPSKNLSVAEIKDAVVAVNEVSNPLELDDFALEYDMSLTMDNIEDFSGVKSNDGGNSATVLVVKAAAGKAGDVAKELKAYKDYQVDYYGGYAEFADAKAQIENGIVETSGDYAVLVFANTEGASYSDIENAVKDCF